MKISSKTFFFLVLLTALSLFLVGCETSDASNVVVDPIKPTNSQDASADFASYDVVCTLEQQQVTICTADYRPVCADDGETYGNGCSACSSGVNAYNDGACGESGEPDRVLDHICSDAEKENAICTFDYNPVCGSDGTTYGNACGACASNITGWSRGECK